MTSKKQKRPSEKEDLRKFLPSMKTPFNYAFLDVFKRDDKSEGEYFDWKEIDTDSWSSGKTVASVFYKRISSCH